MMRYCSVSVERRAMVLTMTMGSYALAKVIKAMRTLYPTTLPSSSARSTMVAETLVTSESGTPPPPSPPSLPSSSCLAAETDGAPLGETTLGDSMDVESLLADAEEEKGVMIADALLDPESVTTWLVEEEEFIWSLVTWQKARQSLNAAKLGRRFPTVGKEGKADLHKALARVKCWNCGTRGHLSKDCPRPKRTDCKLKGTGKGVTKQQVKK